jgi:capsule polysaccharide export protein KpsE/RkpR
MGEQSLGKDNPELIEKKQRREAIQHQLKRLEIGGTDTSYFSLPVASIPGLKGEYELLYGRVRVTESIYNMLLEQLERARIQEEEQSPSISVLDRARPPELRSRPQRTMMVGATFGLSLIAALLLAALLEYLDRMKSRRPEDYARAQFVTDAFLGWLPGVRRPRNKRA